MATTTIRDGIYRIEHVIYGGPVQYLTRSHGDVTILPSGGPSDPNQEWRILNVDDGNIIIEVPGFVPGNYLTYEGAPKEPEARDRNILRPDPQRPPNKWNVVSGNIRVAGSDLGIRMALIRIFPPQLELWDPSDQLKWEFQRVRDLNE